MSDWPERMGWTPELWDQFWTEAALHHEALAAQARQQIGRIKQRTDDIKRSL